MNMEIQKKIWLSMFMWFLILFIGSWSFGFARGIFVDYHKPQKPKVHILENGAKVVQFPDGEWEYLVSRNGGVQFRPSDQD